MDKERFVSVCEDNGWDVHEDGDELRIHQYSPAGEDFSFYISNAYNPDEVDDYFFDFDPEEHCMMWLEAKKNGVRGVPGLFVLVDDARAILSMLDKLTHDLYAAQRQTA